MIDVSIGIAAYNSAEFIEQAVESILSQDGPSFEVIVVDDGSTDETAAMVREIAERDNRVRLYTKKNAGLGASRNDVIDQAVGKYIHFMDGDDYMGPHFLDALVSRAEALRADVIVSSYYEVHENDLVAAPRGLPTDLAHYTKAFSWKEKPNVLLSRTPVWDKLYRREFLLANEIRFIESGAEDIPFSWQTLVLAERIGTVWTPYFYYRVRKGSLTSGVSLIDDVFTAVQVSEDFLKTQPMWRRIQPYFVGRSICEIGYLLVKARSGFINNQAAREKYFSRLIDRFKRFDIDIAPKVYTRLDPLYFEIYSAVRQGLSPNEMAEWFATHVSPFAQSSPKGYVLRWDTRQFKSVLRFAMNKLVWRR